MEAPIEEFAQERCAAARDNIPYILKIPVYIGCLAHEFRQRQSFAVGIHSRKSRGFRVEIAILRVGIVREFFAVNTANNRVDPLVAAHTAQRIAVLYVPDKTHSFGRLSCSVVAYQSADSVDACHDARRIRIGNQRHLARPRQTTGGIATIDKSASTAVFQTTIQFTHNHPDMTDSFDIAENLTATDDGVVCRNARNAADTIIAVGFHVKQRQVLDGACQFPKETCARGCRVALFDCQTEYRFAISVKATAKAVDWREFFRGRIPLIVHAVDNNALHIHTR